MINRKSSWIEDEDIGIKPYDSVVDVLAQIFAGNEESREVGNCLPVPEPRCQIVGTAYIADFISP